MSDDEYYAESPYDEFEEMLWDADPAPSLVDDLAQHAAYSPVWQDDPVGELEQYHSDWEYYSDDYYDDDPAILRRNPIDGSPSLKNESSQVSTKRVRKRKLADTCENFETAEVRSLRSTIRGTVWAKHKITNIPVFRRGQQEKVALLTDWKEKFRLEQNRAVMPGNARLKRDESWANDLSLADMGLGHFREQSVAEQTKNVGSDETSDEEDEKEQNLSAEDSEGMLIDEAVSEELNPTSFGLEGDITIGKQPDLALESQTNHSDSASTSQNRKPGLRKKRKHPELLQEHVPLTAQTVRNNEIESNGSKIAVRDTSGLESARLRTSYAQSLSSPNGQVHNSSTNKDAMHATKKRKLSDPADAAKLALGPGETSDGVAINKLGETESLDKTPGPPARNTRAAKARRI